MPRTSTIVRNTNETRISLSLNLDGSGSSRIETGIGFFNHMLTLFAAHGHFDLDIQVAGDLDVDGHHTVEDVGIALGQAFDEALGDKRGIRRYGFFLLPMDEALAEVALDFSGRPCLVFHADFPPTKVGEFDLELIHEFWQAFASNARANLHMNLQYGSNEHHKSEALFKATGRAARQAVELDPAQKGIPSTKGTL